MKRFSILLLVLVVVATSFDVDARKRRTGRQSSSSASQSTALPTNVTTTESELSYDAVSYFRRAQEGDAEAMFLLSQCFNDGIGAKKDFKKAVYWANKASENGCTAGTWFVAASCRLQDCMARVIDQRQRSQNIDVLF